MPGGNLLRQTPAGKKIRRRKSASPAMCGDRLPASDIRLCFYLMWPVRLRTKEPLLSLVKKSTDFLTSPLLHDDETRLMGIVTKPPGGIVWSN